MKGGDTMSIEDLDKTVNINFRVPRAYREAVNEKAAELGISSSMKKVLLKSPVTPMQLSTELL